MKQNRVDYAEDGGAGGDTESESDDGDKGKGGRFEKLTEGVAEIV